MISEMMGVSFGRADIYRRALEKPNKKGNKELFEDFLNNGVTNAVKNGIDEEGAKRIQKAIIDNAGYLFNKSHSIAYSYISYWTAWVKANYPLIFYLSLFNTEPVSKLQDCMQEAIKHGIKIEPPDISKSKFESTIEDKENMVIRMGLNCVKGIGDKAVEELTPQQPFSDFADYFERAGKGSGKGVVEAGIKIGAFESMPIKIHKQLIPDNCPLNIKDNGEEVQVYLNREQQLIWYNSYLDNKKNKAVPNYAIPYDLIKGEYFDNFDSDELIQEKDGTLIIPETMLDKFGFNETQAEQYKTRKKPKGVLKTAVEEFKMTPIEKGFKSAYEDIVACKESKLQQYLQNMEDFELSFIPHPLEAQNKMIVLINEAKDGATVKSAGIIVDIITRQTKTGKPFYNVILQTPREKQRLTVWGNIFNNYRDILTVNHIIKITGKIGFGGITVDGIWDAKANYN